MRTTTIYNIVHSELIKKGLNEFVDEDDNLIYFDSDLQFMNKIFSYDEDVYEIVDDLFNGMKLDDPVHDEHFKRNFLYRFINRQINRQTIESFKLELLSVFMSNKTYINMVYEDLEDHILQKNISHSDNEQNNNQVNSGSTTTDNRSAFSDLPQSQSNLDVNDTSMSYATDNTISRNKQTNHQQTDGSTSNESNSENRSYSLDELFKSNGVLENILNIFDIKCFLQVF